MGVAITTMIVGILIATSLAVSSELRHESSVDWYRFFYLGRGSASVIVGALIGLGVGRLVLELGIV